jgi:hypothetical protein
MAKRRSEKHRCVRCGRKALYRRPGTGKLVARKDHELCQRCFRSDCDSARAQQLNQYLEKTA